MAVLEDPVDELAVEIRYSPHDPEPPQHAFLLLDDLGVREAFYGGAAGGGKSDALLMGALRYVDVPGYNALLLRKTYAELALPEALIARSLEWLSGSDARWNGTDYRWTFPSGATLTFGYLQSQRDRYRYQGAAFQFIGFDELTHFTEDEYRYLFSRCRRPDKGAKLGHVAGEYAEDHPLASVPLRVRAASNPGGVGHKWVKRRFIDRLPDPDNPEDTPAKCAARVFIPAKIDDNPHLDRDTYTENLNELDPETRAQLLDGDWDAGGTGDVFARKKHGDYRLDRAGELGRRFDALLAGGKLPPPAGGSLELGIDWGEHTGYVIAWPFPAGGRYFVRAGELDAHEPGDAFTVIVDEELAAVAELAWPIIYGRRFDARRDDPLELLDDVRYDAAGIASMRTFMALARRRRPRLKTIKVSFGARAQGASDRKSVKREVIGYIRRLAKRVNELEAAAFARTGGDGLLAVGARAAEWLREAKSREWEDADAGKLAKGDDHAFDAGIALLGPVARRFRVLPRK